MLSGESLIEKNAVGAQLKGCLAYSNYKLLVSTSFLLLLVGHLLLVAMHLLLVANIALGVFW